MDILDLDSLFAQLILGLGAALVLGNGFALWMARRGVKPRNAQGELRRGRAWFLLAVGAVITAWGSASLFTKGGDQEPAVTTTTAAAGSTSTSTSPTVTTTPLPPTFAVEGALPDGRAYVVSGLDREEQVEGIFVAIYIHIAPEQPVLGMTTFRPGPAESSEPTWVGDMLVIPTGDWTVSIAVYQEVLDRLGQGGRELIASAIRGYSVSKMPVLDLSYPLRFAADHEVPLQMEVVYESFTVRRRCDPRPGVVCSSDEAVQAIPRHLVDGYPPPPQETFALESTYTGDHVRFLVLGVNPEAPFSLLNQIDHATSQEELDGLWWAFGIPGEPPTINFERYVVLFYDRPDDNCPDYLLLLYMDQDRLIPKFAPPGGSCTQPLIPTAYAVSIDRDTVPERFVAFMGAARSADPEVEHEVDPAGDPPG